MAGKERQINERSLENLKLGAEARRQGKIRQNVTILPETSEWLKRSGNASGMIDNLVAAARNDELKSNYTHQQIEAEQQVSNSVYEEMTALQEELAHWKAKALGAEIVIPKLEDELHLLREGLTQVKTQQTDFEAARDRALSKLKLGRQAPEYKRSKKAMDLLLLELRG